MAVRLLSRGVESTLFSCLCLCGAPVENVRAYEFITVVPREALLCREDERGMFRRAHGAAALYKSAHLEEGLR